MICRNLVSTLKLSWMVNHAIQMGIQCTLCCSSQFLQLSFRIFLQWPTFHPPAKTHTVLSQPVNKYLIETGSCFCIHIFNLEVFIMSTFLNQQNLVFNMPIPP